MGNPAIFSGRRTKLLTADGLLNSNGSINDNNGVKNYITNGHAEVNAAGWVISKNTVAAATPDSGFVTAGVNLDFVRQPSTTMGGQAYFELSKTGSTSRLGEQVYLPFSIDPIDKAKQLQVSFDMRLVSQAGNGFTGSVTPGTYSDFSVFIWDVTNSTLIPVASPYLEPMIVWANAENYQFKSTFQTAANSTSYRLILHCANTNIGNFSLGLKDVTISRQVTATGAIITDPVAYTPTFTGFGTVTVQNFTSYRKGAVLVVNGTFTTGTVTATEGRVSLGFAGGNSNVTTKSTLPTLALAGQIKTNNTATASDFQDRQILIEASKSYMTFSASYASYGTGLSKANGNGLTTTGAILSFYGEFPIEGWSSNVALSSDYDGRVISAGANTQNPLGTLGASFNVTRFQTLSGDTTASYSIATGLYTCPVSGWYRASSTLDINHSSISVGQLIAVALRKNGSTTFGSQFIAAPSVSVLEYMPSTSGSIYCNAGETLGVYSYSSGTTPVYSTNFIGSTFAVERISGPVQIAASETVSMRYTNSAGTAIGTGIAVLPYPTLVFDTHNQYNTTTGLYTCNSSGLWQVNAQFCTAGVSLLTSQSIDLYIRKNGVDVERRLVLGNGAAVNYNANTSTIIQCNAGDTIGVFAVSAVATTAVTAAILNTLSISKIK